MCIVGCAQTNSLLTVHSTVGKSHQQDESEHSQQTWRHTASATTHFGYCIFVDNEGQPVIFVHQIDTRKAQIDYLSRLDLFAVSQFGGIRLLDRNFKEILRFPTLFGPKVAQVTAVVGIDSGHARDQLFQVELVVAYNNYFVERVFVFPTSQPLEKPTVERVAIYEYKGPMSYYCAPELPSKFKLVESHYIVAKTPHR